MTTINLHCFEKYGTYFLVDKYSRRYSAISEAEYHSVLDLKRRRQTSPFGELEVTEEDLDEIGSALQKLDPGGHTTEKFNLPFSLTAAPTIAELEARKSVLYLHVTGACNLRCPWCYTGEKVNYKLAETNVEHAVNSIAETGKGGPYTIRFFGGEPLMNMDLIKRSVAYCDARPEQFEYTITTNGLLLNKSNSDYLTDHDFLISISIMGYKEVHDKGRIFPNGEGSFDQVIAKARTFFKNYKYDNIGANITVPTGEFDYVFALQTLMEVGFRRFKFIEISDGGSLTDEHYASEVLARRKLLEFYVKTLDSGIEINLLGGVSFAAYVNLIDDRDSILLPACPMHAEVSMDHKGNYIPCHRWMDEKFADVKSVVKRQKEIIDSVSYDDCRSCWAEYACGKGVCYWKRHHYDPDSPGPTQQECRKNGRWELIEGAFYVHDHFKTQKSQSGGST